MLLISLIVDLILIIFDPTDLFTLRYMWYIIDGCGILHCNVLEIEGVLQGRNFEVVVGD